MAAGLGANVWIPRDSSWARASVVSSDGMQLCVRREEDNVEVVLDSSQVYLYNNEDVEVRRFHFSCNDSILHFRPNEVYLQLCAFWCR